MMIYLLCNNFFVDECFMSNANGLPLANSCKIIAFILHYLIDIFSFSC